MFILSLVAAMLQLIFDAGSVENFKMLYGKSLSIDLMPEH